MSKEAHDVFALVFNFLGKDWVLKHITIGLFETSKTFKQTLKNNYKNFYNNMD
jgi:high-affinity Fe2+/Pb2+ permease